MTLFKEAKGLKKYISQQKKEGKIIGFVPTMGALHTGHMSLISKCKNIVDVTVCSIFVNPTQFNDPKDFEKYPVTIGNDIFQLETSGCDLLFLPSVGQIYPYGTKNLSHYDLGNIENLLEGKYRPGHFQGVCQVVHRLLEVVTPDYLFMGQKDYQQSLIVKKLVQLIEMQVEVETAGTFRENSGLAMSSRNMRLSEKQKEEAIVISKTLEYIKSHYRSTPLRELELYAKEFLLNSGFKIVDYVSIANAETLQPAQNALEPNGLVALAAATIGEIRLIDNLFLSA